MRRGRRVAGTAGWTSAGWTLAGWTLAGLTIASLAIASVATVALLVPPVAAAAAAQRSAPRPAAEASALAPAAVPVVLGRPLPPVDPAEYAARRRQVAEAIGEDALLVLLAPEPAHRNGDVDWPFRQDDDLYYLTGVGQPDTALALLPGESAHREVLFAADADPRAALWTGRIPPHDELAAASGVADVASAGQLRDLLGAALDGAPWGESDLYGYYRQPAFPRLAAAVRAGRAAVWLDLGPRGFAPPGGAGGRVSPELALAREIRDTWPEVAIRNASPLLHGLRQIKSPAELERIQRAIDVTTEAIRAAMRRAPIAERENQLQATIEYTFRELGACCWGFPSIVGAGEHTMTLHYPHPDAPIPPGSLVLTDVGAEVEGYTADVTRTFPADGVFSPAQEAIYQAVLDTADAMLPELTAGTVYADVHGHAVSRIGEELLRLGLVAANLPEQVTSYFPHGLGHPLGLQVHDVFDRSRALEPGMVWTLEPGLYVRRADVETSDWYRQLDDIARAAVAAALDRYAGIGVRIEDDVLITDGAPRMLSAGAPRSVRSIQELMGPGG